MTNHRNNGMPCTLCGGVRTNRRAGVHGVAQDPLWGACGTYPRQTRQGTSNHVPNCRNQRRDGYCPQARAEQSNQNNGGGCGCGGHNHNDCQKLLQQIRTVDFALYEVILYLDVYPASCEALDTYHKLLARRKSLYEQYESICGPVTAMGNTSHTAWDWIEKPFPWENAAN